MQSVTAYVESCISWLFCDHVVSFQHVVLVIPYVVEKSSSMHVYVLDGHPCESIFMCSLDKSVD